MQHLVYRLNWEQGCALALTAAGGLQAVVNEVAAGRDPAPPIVLWVAG